MTDERSPRLDDRSESTLRHTAVRRCGNIVAREARAWTTTVHSLLRHLEAVGFEGAPRVAGSGFDGHGRETLTYIDGHFHHPGQPTVDAAARVGELLGELHNATSSFRPPTDATWKPWFGRDLGGVTPVIGHGDAAPWNIVVQDELPVALIDWDHAGPVDPLVELAQAAWLNANLYSDDIPEHDALPPVTYRASQLRALIDAYGLTRQQRRRFVGLIVEVAIHSTAADADEARVAPDTKASEALWGMAWKARSAAWILRNQRVLDNAMS